MSRSNSILLDPTLSTPLAQYVVHRMSFPLFSKHTSSMVLMLLIFSFVVCSIVNVKNSLKGLSFPIHPNLSSFKFSDQSLILYLWDCFTWALQQQTSFSRHPPLLHLDSPLPSRCRRCEYMAMFEGWSIPIYID